MLNYKQIMQTSIAKFNVQGQRGELLLNYKNKSAKIFSNLDFAISKLAEDTKRYSLHSNNQKINRDAYKKELLADFAKAMNLYILFASVKNWLDVIDLSNDDQMKIKKLSADNDLNQIYLSIKKMLFNGYFNHDKKDFQFSWKMFNKFGIVDFGVDEQELTKYLEQLNAIN